MATPDLSPYLRQESAIRSDFSAKSTANTFSKTLSQQRGSRDVADFQRGFGREYGGFAAGFGQRGMSGGGIQSGVQQRAMTNYLGDYQRNFGYMQQDLADNQNQFDFNQQNFEAERERALADVLAAKQATIAQTASAINGISPYFGGR